MQVSFAFREGRIWQQMLYMIPSYFALQDAFSHFSSTSFRRGLRARESVTECCPLH